MALTVAPVQLTIAVVTDAEEQQPGIPLLAHIRRYVVEGSLGLTDDAEPMPDDDNDGPIRFAPGFSDAMRAAGGDREAASEGEAADIEILIRVAVADPSGAAFDRLYANLLGADPLELVPDLVDRLRARPRPAEGVLRLARRLIRESCHRDPLKVGIALFGLGFDAEDRDDMLVRARHDEFTRYVLDAVIGADGPQVEEDLYAIARVTENFGRVAAVEALRNTTRSDIANWLVRQGFRDVYMYEYTAIAAATAGDLCAQLVGEPDQEMLDAACDLVPALLAPVHGAHVDAYPRTAESTRLLLTHLERRASDLTHFRAVEEIRDFLDWSFPTDESPSPVDEHGDMDSGWDGDPRPEFGWTEDLIAQCRSSAKRILAHDRWLPMAVAGLNDEIEFHDAEHVARALGHDTFPKVWDRVREKSSLSRWDAVMTAVDRARLDEVLAYADAVLSADALPAGPLNEHDLCWGEPQDSLAQVVGRLDQFPGCGWSLIRRSLACAVSRNRNIALNTLESWDPADLPSDAEFVLRTARGADRGTDREARYTALLARLGRAASGSRGN
jgi:hypothetical protein